MSSVRVTGEITEESADRFLADLGQAPDPVEIFIETNGGRVGAALKMAAAVEGRSVHAIVRRADSAGLALVAAAESRQYAPNASALVHPVTVSATRTFEATPGELLEVAEEAAENEHNLLALLARRSGKPVAWWQDAQEREVTLDASELEALFPANVKRVPVESAIAEALSRVNWSNAIAEALKERGWHPSWPMSDKTAALVDRGWRKD